MPVGENTVQGCIATSLTPDCDTASGKPSLTIPDQMPHLVYASLILALTTLDCCIRLDYLSCCTVSPVRARQGSFIVGHYCVLALLSTGPRLYSGMRVSVC
jgi:hypothetical protein